LVETDLAASHRTAALEGPPAEFGIEGGLEAAGGLALHAEDAVGRAGGTGLGADADAAVAVLEDLEFGAGRLDPEQADLVGEGFARLEGAIAGRGGGLFRVGPRDRQENEK